VTPTLRRRRTLGGRANSLLALGGLAISLLALAGLLLIARLPDTRGWGAAENWGHLPLFGVLALLLLAVGRSLVPALRRSPIGAHVFAFASAALLGASTELLQGLVGRDASGRDWINDVAGAALFLGFAASFESRGATRSLTHGQRRVWRAALVAVFLATAWPVFGWVLAYAQRDRAFPQLLEFESAWERRFLVLQSAELDSVPPPPGWPLAPPWARVARLSFSPDASHAAEFTGYSGFFVDEIHPDWRGYRDLVFLAFVPSREPVRLSLRIEDEQHQTNNAPSDRFHLDLVAQPGMQEVRVSLAAVERAPATRSTDLGAIRVLHLFVYEPTTAFSVYVDGFRLE
jgi:hypothetical protein